MKAKMKKGSVVLLVLFIIFSANLFGGERRFEISLTQSGVVSESPKGLYDLGGTLRFVSYAPYILSYDLSFGYVSKIGIGGELGIHRDSRNHSYSANHVNLSFSANLVIAPFNKLPIEPYALAGYHGHEDSHNLNVGGGLFIKLAAPESKIKIACRIEYDQRFFIFDYWKSRDPVGLVRAGISIFF